MVFVDDSRVFAWHRHPDCNRQVRGHWSRVVGQQPGEAEVFVGEVLRRRRVRNRHQVLVRTYDSLGFAPCLLVTEALRRKLLVAGAWELPFGCEMWQEQFLQPQSAAWAGTVAVRRAKERMAQVRADRLTALKRSMAGIGSGASGRTSAQPVPAPATGPVPFRPLSMLPFAPPFVPEIATKTWPTAPSAEPAFQWVALNTTGTTGLPVDLFPAEEVGGTE